MKVDERRKALAEIIMAESKAVPGGVLAERLNVSRQIIVQDIAILKASGYDILSTHHGYIIKESPLAERVLKVRHTSEQTREELSGIVELGGTVVDVFVWHKVYGKIKVDLNIFSKLGIEKFIDGINSGKSTELMHITDGYHYHTVRAESAEALDEIELMLKEKNFIVPEI